MGRKIQAMPQLPYIQHTYPAVTDELLNTLVTRIWSAGTPVQIILFGSRVWGTPRPDSDIDLMVIEKPGVDCQEIYRTYCDAVRGVFPEINIIVHSLDEALAWRNVPNHLITQTLRSGRTLFQFSSRSRLDYAQAPSLIDGSGAVFVCEEVEPKTPGDLAREWFGLGDDDIESGRLILSQGVRLAHVFYFAQQAIEKYLKGFILLHGRTLPRTHDLCELHKQCNEIADFPELATLDLKNISESYIPARYTASFRPSVEQASIALAAAERVRESILVAVPPEARP